jgi:ActR/RegA family two-component response regulator
MTDITKDISVSYGKSVNILLVDDDSSMVYVLGSMLSSPFVNLSTCATFPEALAAAGMHEKMWHCWVLDVDLGEGHTSVELMQHHPNYPFVIIISGLKSMSIAAEAVCAGAIGIFDKSPQMFDGLIDAVCKTAALGFVLGGKATKYLPVFKLLTQDIIFTPKQWAEHAAITLRQMQRICELHPFPTPKHTISLYYGLYYLLIKTVKTSVAIDPDTEFFFNNCVEYLHNKHLKELLG